AMKFADVAGRTRIRKVYEPITGHRDVYDQAFTNFTDVYKRLSPWYRRINRNGKNVST
ncbi:MAG: hypothetical protein HKN47_04790, partial [Pirellulaceae bacterium]|nr:hypothetical protein [Pirellulaceae bacterium]